MDSGLLPDIFHSVIALVALLPWIPESPIFGGLREEAATASLSLPSFFVQLQALNQVIVQAIVQAIQTKG